MKRFLALSVLVLAVGVAAGVALAARSGGPGHGHGHGAKRHGGVSQVVEHATTDAVTNRGEGAGADRVGDLLTFTNEIFDASNTRSVGHDQGFCIRTIVGAAWECWWTTFLPHGQLTVEGPFYDSHDSRLAITGGTDAYAHARGWMELNARAGGTEFDFIFHLNH
jgi:allene oxide cyclase